MTQLASIQVEVFVLRELMYERPDVRPQPAVVQQRIDQLLKLQLQQVDQVVDDIMSKVQAEYSDSFSEGYKQTDRPEIHPDLHQDDPGQ